MNLIFMFRIPAAALQFVAAVLGEDFLRDSEKEPNMAQVERFSNIVEY